MKKTLVLGVFLLIPVVIFASGYASRKAALAPDDEGKVIISTNNDYVAIQLDTEDGQFNIGTADGRMLLYAYPSYPWSSWVTLNVDGYLYVNNPPSPGSPWTGFLPVTEPFVLVPASGDSNRITGGWTVRNVFCRQTVMPVYLVYTEDTTGTIFIHYYIENRDDVPHDVGVLLEMDTDINHNDAAPLGTIFGYSGVAEDFYGPDSIPAFWFAYEDPAGPPPLGDPDQLIAMGILDAYDAVRPDRFAVGSWPDFYRIDAWDHPVPPSPYGDSAVLIWWYPRTLAPGDTMVVATYYGLGHVVAEGALSLAIPPGVTIERCEYEEFEVTVLVTNTSWIPMDSTEATIFLPEGLELAPGETATHHVSPYSIPARSTGSTGWRVVPNGEVIGDLTVNVMVTSPDIEPMTISGTIFVPEIPGRPEAELLTPEYGERTTCPDQNIEMRLRYYAEPDILEFDFEVNGERYILTSPEIELGDSTLRFTPSANWEDGDTVYYSLNSFADTLGCALVAPVSGIFIVDLSGPVADNFYPADGTVLGTTVLPDVYCDISDNLTEVDTSSIIFVFNGDTFTVDGSVLTFEEGRLTFHPAVAGITGEDGETYTCELLEAKDMPSAYCPANPLQNPTTWSFTLNIIDISLPDTSGYVGDTILIPIYTENLAGYRITTYQFDIGYNPDVLIPIGLATEGTASDAGDYDANIEVSEGSLTLTYTTTSTVGSENVLIYIVFVVNPTAADGSFTSLRFISTSFNDGGLIGAPVDGFFTVLWGTPEWMVDLHIQGSGSGQAEAVLTFGAASRASEGYDPGLDVVQLPPVPGTVNAYFDILDPRYPLIRRLQRDIQNSHEMPITWYLQTVGEPDGVIQWEPELLPPGLATIGGVNMKLYREYRFGLNELVEIVYDRPELKRFTSEELCPGWNLISFPVLPSTPTRIADMITNLTTPNGYWYNPETGGYELKEHAELGKGYWVLSEGSSVIDMAGMEVQEIEIPIHRGWNLIGGVFSETGIPVSSFEFEPEGIMAIPSIYSFNCETRAYEISSVMLNGYGYWLLASGDGRLTIRTDAEAKATTTENLLLPERLFSITVGETRLSFGVDPRASDGIDRFDTPLPPAVPGETSQGFESNIPGVFLSRDVKQTSCWVLPTEPGVVIRWNSDELEDGMSISDGITTVDMKSSQRFVPATDRVVLKWELSGIPKGFSLGQNIPNPFNLKTEIVFETPKEAFVQLGVYNILGRRVKTVISETVPAGKHSVSWDGKDESGSPVPSGIYFYQMKAEDYSATRRMLLLK